MRVLDLVTEFWIHLRHLDPMCGPFVPSLFQSRGQRWNSNLSANFWLSLLGGLGNEFGGDAVCGVPEDA